MTDRVRTLEVSIKITCYPSAVRSDLNRVQLGSSLKIWTYDTSISWLDLVVSDDIKKNKTRLLQL